MRKETVLRRDLLALLSGFRDDADIIKIICGVRRCGKSTLMSQYIDLLKDSGVPESNIVYLNLESDAQSDLRDRLELMEAVKERMGEGMNYVLIDEIQNVNEWEIAVNAMRVSGNMDVYITGSNSNLLSSELSTHLTGRYVSLEVFPLSFREYLDLNGENEDLYEMFERYLQYGAFPMIDPFESEKRIKIRLTDLFSSIVYKDILMRENIRDAAELEKIVKFMMFNIGNPLSVNKIANSLGINPKTAGRYLWLLEEAYIFYRADRFDIKKTSLNPNPKYYSVDTGLRNMPLEYSNEDYGRQMENIVYLELKRRGHTVKVERYGDKEVDFSVKTLKGYVYYQVTTSMMNESVKERELGSLRSIDNNYPKVVISADRLKADFKGGIKHINIIDWLLDDKEELIKNF